MGVFALYFDAVPRRLLEKVERISPSREVIGKTWDEEAGTMRAAAFGTTSGTIPLDGSLDAASGFDASIDVLLLLRGPRMYLQCLVIRSDEHSLEVCGRARIHTWEVPHCIRLLYVGNGAGAHSWTVYGDSPRRCGSDVHAYERGSRRYAWKLG